MAHDILLDLDDSVIEKLKLKAELNSRTLEEQITGILTDVAHLPEGREQESSTTSQNAPS
jgi:plasmid stability protein